MSAVKSIMREEQASRAPAGSCTPADFMRAPRPQWRRDREAHLPAFQTREKAPPRLSRPHGDQGRPPGDRAPAREGPQAALGLMGEGGSPPDGIERLKKRADFLAAARAKSCAMPGVVVQA